MQHDQPHAGLTDTPAVLHISKEAEAEVDQMIHDLDEWPGSPRTAKP